MATTYYHATPGRLAWPPTSADTVAPTEPDVEPKAYALFENEQEAVNLALDADPSARTISVMRCRFVEGAVVCGPYGDDPRHSAEDVRPLVEEMGMPEERGMAWWAAYNVTSRVHAGQPVSDAQLFQYAAFVSGFISGAVGDLSKVIEFGRLLRLAGVDGASIPAKQVALAFTPSAVEVLSTETRRL